MPVGGGAQPITRPLTARPGRGHDLFTNHRRCLSMTVLGVPMQMLSMRPEVLEVCDSSLGGPAN